jgi:hypothetical protein
MASLIAVNGDDKFHARATQFGTRHADPHWPVGAELLILQGYSVVILRHGADAERREHQNRC